ncbi:MAG: hypothetical protein A3J74_08960 [Elusimicrobia bacterium RIFCSPHIGHO2_02_FULL_57_9]|nr:MAG: hypothetical protein A3J74_08960 [Elusimicrobia bacterium RIFCSPHIGHO2_02_FULL_57_9]
MAILFSAGYRQKKDDLIGFLDQSALTISKKPLYLRKVFFEEIKSDSDAKELVAKILSAHAVVALGILEGFFDGKIRELQEAMNAGGLLFRVISPMDIQKRSMAVDILVDMLLLNPEA